jgi:hypothetical protein
MKRHEPERCQPAANVHASSALTAAELSTVNGASIETMAGLPTKTQQQKWMEDEGDGSGDSTSNAPVLLQKRWGWKITQEELDRTPPR